MNLAGKRVLITGSTGFIGNRLVEVLGRAGVDIRALVHQFMHASRIARFPLQMYGGSILDKEAVAQAMTGADVVFHLAFGAQGTKKERREATVEGTRVVCENALRCGVSRLVYTSTFSVYGATEYDDLNEECPRKKSGDLYADSKLKAENLVLELHRQQGLPVVVLQPTIVYGPFSFWSRWPLEQLRRGTVVLPDNGDGLCNAVYIDDAVNALIRAATLPRIEGEVFLISGEEPCSWLEYYTGYAKMIEGAEVDLEPMRQMQAGLQAASRKSTLSGLFKRGIRSACVQKELLSVPAVRALYDGFRNVMPRPAWELVRNWSSPQSYAEASGATQARCYPSPSHLELLRSPTRVSIDKAVKMLGWKPEISLPAGLERTEAWAKWFGLA